MVATINYKNIAEYFLSIANELKCKNRFFNSKLDDLVNLLIKEESNKITFSKATFKRARIYREADAVDRFLHPKNKIFEGYDAEGSFVKKENVNEGRCNPKFIPYLYAADSVSCSIAEINPCMGSIVSVADIEVKEELRFLNLAKSFAISNTCGSIIEDVPDCDVILYLQSMFSRPYEQEGDYLLPQYISERIKNSGFDGLIFQSSKYAYKDTNGIMKYGHNFVIFNYEKCEAVSSKLYRVESIDIKYANV